MGDQLSDDERGRLGLALAGLGLVHDLVAIRSSGVTPGDTDRSTLRTTARRVDEATRLGFGLAALAEQVLGEASQGGGGDPLARPVVDWIQTMTCKQLGGPGPAISRCAEAPLTRSSRRRTGHLKEAVASGDQTHESALQD